MSGESFPQPWTLLGGRAEPNINKCVRGRLSLPAKGKALPAVAERRQASRVIAARRAQHRSGDRSIPYNRVFYHSLLTRRGGKGLSKGRVVSDDLPIGAN